MNWSSSSSGCIPITTTTTTADPDYCSEALICRGQQESLPRNPVQPHGPSQQRTAAPFTPQPGRCQMRNPLASAWPISPPRTGRRQRGAARQARAASGLRSGDDFIGTAAGTSAAGRGAPPAAGAGAGSSSISAQDPRQQENPRTACRSLATEGRCASVGPGAFPLVSGSPGVVAARRIARIRRHPVALLPPRAPRQVAEEQHQQGEADARHQQEDQ
jgi:hypothetical protein